MDFEQTMMELLINAGEARSQAMMAIQQARKRDWEGADAALAASDEAAKGTGRVPMPRWPRQMRPQKRRIRSRPR